MSSSSLSSYSGSSSSLSSHSGSSSSGSSSSLVLSSSSISSVEVEVDPADLAASMPEEPLFYLLIVPKFGETELLAYKTMRKMVKELTHRLDKKQTGAFNGEVYVFQGLRVEYSEPVMNYRLNVPNIGELSVSGGSKDKYVQPVPKKQ